MANRYFFDDTDISTLTNITTTINNTDISNSFSNFPGTIITKTRLPSQPSNFITNYGTTLDADAHAPSYFSYHSDEEGEAPPFYITSGTTTENIFSKNRHSTYYQKIGVKNVEITSGTGDLLVPSWCNAIKMFFVSKKGGVGSSGSHIGAVNGQGGKHSTGAGFEVRLNANNDGTNNNQTGNSNDYNRTRNTNHYHYNHRTDFNHTKYGGSGGDGGTACMGWFSKYIKFPAGSANKINYTVSNADSGASRATLLNQNNTSIADYYFYNGAKGGTGSNAWWYPAAATHDDYNTYTHTGNDDDDNWTWYEHNNHRWTANGVTQHGSKGNPGGRGYLNMQKAGTSTWLSYNVTSNESSKLIVYYFKYAS
jgi:hypothetical protein